MSRINNAWRKALKQARIKYFRWHDLRHTWASWHVQSGTSLHELQQLGGWSDYDTVLRYAHLSSDHLQQAAERVSDRFSSQAFGVSSQTIRDNQRGIWRARKDSNLRPFGS